MKQCLFFIVVIFFNFSCQTKSKPGEVKDEANKSVEIKKTRPKDNSLVPRGFDFANAPEVIAFGSCANQDSTQPVWDIIFKSNPDLFILAGDNVYASKPENKPISAQYKKLNAIPEFRHFREHVPIMATWDDHDYGVNDGGADNPEKEEAQREFLYQWSYVKDSVRVNQKGIYHAKILGGVRKRSPTLQVILLDTRWFRSPLNKIENSETGVKSLAPTDDKKTTILGDEQWDWLERQLRKPADVRIVVSSIQLIAEEHGYEKWANFPHEKEKFFNLLKKIQPKNLFVISGDRHRGSIAKQEIKGWGTLYDITSSSINRPSDSSESDKSYIGEQFKSENFGLVLLDWTRRKIELQLRDSSNATVNQVEFRIR